MKLGALSALLALGALAACATTEAECERVAGQVQFCTAYDADGGLHEVYVAEPTDTPPARDRVRLLARGVTGGPNVVAVDTCGARARVYLLDGMFDVDTTTAPFEVEDLTGSFAGTREAVNARRDSLLAARPSCFVRDER